MGELGFRWRYVCRSDQQEQKVFELAAAVQGIERLVQHGTQIAGSSHTGCDLDDGGLSIPNIGGASVKASATHKAASFI